MDANKQWPFLALLLVVIAAAQAATLPTDRTSSSRTPDEEPEKTTHPLNNEGSLIFDQDKENKEASDNGSGSTGDENNLVITLVSSLSSTIIAVITSCGVGFCCYRRRMRKCQHNAASSTQTTEMRDSTSTYNNCTFNTMVLPEAAKNWKHFNLPGIAAGLNRIKETEC
ncbi:uncharacterized protein LOC143299367 [Babylonia areolata]|uniref:uncharacterized protein LOC143299367 n=1 Tax=Babylonia areolata TaxID=304850 RepID=UPI003FCFCD39